MAAAADKLRAVVAARAWAMIDRRYSIPRILALAGLFVANEGIGAAETRLRIMETADVHLTLRDEGDGSALYEPAP
jgi:hypothetical protein